MKSGRVDNSTMTIIKKQFEHIANLAYLAPENALEQLESCSAMIHGIETLQTVDTRSITPLHHPTSVTQHLRPDNYVILPNLQDLAQCTPDFEGNFYNVPLIIKGS